MYPANVLVDLVLATFTFYVMNWFGEHVPGKSYMQLSVLYRPDEAPAFNFVFRVIAPLVAVTLYSAIFYWLKMPLLVKNIWAVVAIAFAIRLSYNLACGRSSLLNWPYQFCVGFASTGVAYLLYANVLFDPSVLIPNWASLSPNLWLLAILFIYQAANTIRHEGRSRERKSSYILARHRALRARYGQTLTSSGLSTDQQFLAYAIMILEDFNRPKIFRFLERVVGKLRRAGTYGIMQVHSATPLSDQQSIDVGIMKIKNTYEKVSHATRATFSKASASGLAYMSRESLELIILTRVAWFYNRSDDYAREVMEIFRALKETAGLTPPTKSEEDRYDALWYTRSNGSGNAAVIGD